MSARLRSTIWLLAVIILSAALLTVLDSYEEKKNGKENDVIRGSATVLLIAYDGEEPEEIGDTANLKRIGCRDILVPYEIPVVSKRLQSVLHALSDFKAPLGLHNPMQEKGITLESVQKRGHTAAIVDLAGEPKLGGICDTPRLKGQIEATIAIFEEDAVIRLNGSEKAYDCMGDERIGCR